MIEKRSLKKEVVAKLTSPLRESYASPPHVIPTPSPPPSPSSGPASSISPLPGYRSSSPSSLTMQFLTPEYIDEVIESNQRLCEKYGESHPWHHKYTITIPPFSLKQNVDVVGISVSEWLDLDLNLSNADLKEIVTKATYNADSTLVAFVSVGNYSCPDQRRASASCIVEWEANGKRVQLQVCSQVFFSVQDVEGQIVMSPVMSGHCYINGYRGFSTEVSEKQFRQIWGVLCPALVERSEEILHLPRKRGVCVIGDFETFEERKKPKVIEQIDDAHSICDTDVDSEFMDTSETSRSFVTLPEIPEDLDVSFDEEVETSGHQSHTEEVCDVVTPPPPPSSSPPSFHHDQHADVDDVVDVVDVVDAPRSVSPSSSSPLPSAAVGVSDGSPSPLDFVAQSHLLRCLGFGWLFF